MRREYKQRPDCKDVYLTDEQYTAVVDVVRHKTARAYMEGVCAGAVSVFIVVSVGILIAWHHGYTCTF